MTGRSAASIRAAAAAIASVLAAPSAGTVAGVSTAPGAGAFMTSLGSPRKAVPGRPDSAARKAAAVASEIADGESISAAYLVMGRSNATVSMLWCACFSRSAIGTAPPSATTGSPSVLAVARPVARLETPGPEVTSTTPALPVSRPSPPAMKVAFCSCRQTTSLIFESTSASKTGSILAPGMPNMYSTPWASRLRTSRCAPFFGSLIRHLPDSSSGMTMPEHGRPVVAAVETALKLLHKGDCG